MLSEEETQRRPLNILMLVDSLGIGGTETHALAIAKALKERNHKVIIGTRGGPMAQNFQRAGLEMVTLPFQTDNPLYTNYITLLNMTRRIIKEHDIDLIHAHQIAGLKVAVQISQELLVPLIFTVHGMFYPRRQLQALIDGCAHVIAVSPPAANWVRTHLGYPRKQVSIIPNGIDIQHFKPGPAPNFKKELGINENQPLITLCSRIAWGKTRIIEDVIYAVEELYDTEGTHLALVGSGPDSPFIHALVNMVNQRRGEDIIHITGAMLDPVEAYRAADVVIGTARVALEAMSTGKPVIAAGNSGYFGPVTPANFSEAWEVYFGDHDYLTVPSKRRFVEDIQTVLHNKRASDQAALRKMVASHFRIETVSNSIEELYYQVLSGQASASTIEIASPISRQIEAETPQPATTISKPSSPTGTKPEPKLGELGSPLVSVVIPTYNRAELLDQCLKSVFAQTYRPLEVIVIDDHSSDSTPQVIAKWAKQAESEKELTFIHYRLPRNLGFARAVSMGYLFAQGEFIANHDSDDLSHPERISQQVQFLQLNEDYSLVGTNYEVFSDDPEKRRKSYLIQYDNNIIKSYRAGKHCVCFGSLLMRRQVIERLGGLTTFMNGAEDYEFVARAIVQGFNVQNLRTPLYYYREHSDQRSKEFYSVRSAIISYSEGEEAQ